MAPRPPRPCLDCGTLGQGTRCDDCRKAKGRATPRPPRPHYNGNYRARAKATRESAGPCWICGQGDREGDPWTADHLIPGEIDSPLAKAHKSCNSRRGNTPLEATPRWTPRGWVENC